MITNSFLQEQLDNINEKLDLILRYQNIFYNKGIKNNMSYDLTTLITAVQNEKTVESSILQLVTSLSQQLAAASANAMDDVTKKTLTDLANQLNTNASAMSTAITQNTPVTVTPTTTDTTNATGATGQS